jgi:hypothetical protein
LGETRWSGATGGFLRGFNNSTDRGGVFKVFTTAGVIEFTPTVKGLHAINLRENPDVAYLLVNDADLAYHAPIKTIRRNYEVFTKKQVQRATLARRLMGMIGAPTKREYQGLVRQNFLPDCPITPTDITNAHHIFGPDLANIRGKTVLRRPEHVSTEIFEIPRQILLSQKYVTLVADIMFVNQVPFLISSSRKINLTTMNMYHVVLLPNLVAFFSGLLQCTHEQDIRFRLSSWITNSTKLPITSLTSSSTLLQHGNMSETLNVVFGLSRNVVEVSPALSHTYISHK